MGNREQIRGMVPRSRLSRKLRPKLKNKGQKDKGQSQKGRRTWDSAASAAAPGFCPLSFALPV